ncbi:MAG: hypothetical protein M3R00_04650, partial [Pseudomonadota bacterium]|nr:hypothetical protein [Pseudomonadota bacterium]
LFKKISYGHYDDADFYELRARLYLPATIRSMTQYWLDHFDSFVDAAGEHDEYLAHLLTHVKDPVGFLVKLAQQDTKKREAGVAYTSRKSYIADRLPKIMPVLSKISGSQSKLLRMSFAEGNNKPKRFEKIYQERVSALIAQYAVTGVDVDNQLLNLLDDDRLRKNLRLTAEEVNQLLMSNDDSGAQSHDTRFELIIARDTNLWAKYKSANHEEPHFGVLRGQCPHLYARHKLERVLKKYKGLMPYINREFDRFSDYAGKKIAGEAGADDRYNSIRKFDTYQAFQIVSSDKLWKQVNPYQRYFKISIFLNRITNGWLFSSFTRECEKIRAVNPFFHYRMEHDQTKHLPAVPKKFRDFVLQNQSGVWNKDLAQPADSVAEFMTPMVKSQFGVIVSDTARGDELVEVYQCARASKGEDEVSSLHTCIKNSPKRLSYFLQQLTTPAKINVAKSLLVDTLEKFSTQQIMLFLRNDTNTVDQSSHPVAWAYQALLTYPDKLDALITSKDPELPGTIEILKEVIIALLNKEQELQKGNELPKILIKPETLLSFLKIGISDEPSNRLQEKFNMTPLNFRDSLTSIFKDHPRLFSRLLEADFSKVDPSMRNYVGDCLKDIMLSSEQLGVGDLLTLKRHHPEVFACLFTQTEEANWQSLTISKEHSLYKVMLSMNFEDFKEIIHFVFNKKDHPDDVARGNPVMGFAWIQARYKYNHDATEVRALLAEPEVGLEYLAYEAPLLQLLPADAAKYPLETVRVKMPEERRILGEFENIRSQITVQNIFDYIVSTRHDNDAQERVYEVFRQEPQRLYNLLYELTSDQINDLAIDNDVFRFGANSDSQTHSLLLALIQDAELDRPVAVYIKCMKSQFGELADFMRMALLKKCIKDDGHTLLANILSNHECDSSLLAFLSSARDELDVIVPALASPNFINKLRLYPLILPKLITEGPETVHH